MEVCDPMNNKMPIQEQMEGLRQGHNTGSERGGTIQMASPVCQLNPYRLSFEKIWAEICS